MNETWTAVLAVAGGALSSAAVWFWRWLERRDGREDRRSEWRLRQDASLYDRLLGQADRDRGRIAELEAELRRLEEERDTGWALAWAWYGRSQELYHELIVWRRSDPAAAAAAGPPPPLPEFRAIRKREP